MQDKNQNTNTVGAAQQPVQAQVQAEKTAEAVVNRAAHGDFVTKIIEKIKGSENILVALSKNPSVDEICAAIGLTLFLDGLQHHVTAIYSGKTPNALDFLQPEATFETNTASLQDFIIALNKDKADHLRYKLEGDFVKVYITPYRTSITEEDLSFSRGDFNVDFVIAINVRSAGDLDDALSEHGRIMHDASIVDITRNEPGRFGEIEWSNQAASSVSEMITQLIFAMQGQDKKLDQDVATALLTGIVAATERFSNNRTSSDTLSLASKLMSMGADQQLISANVVANRPVETEAQPEPEPVAEPEAPLVPSPNTVPDPVMYNGTVVLPNVENGIPSAMQAGQTMAAMPGATSQVSPQVNPAAQVAQNTPEQTNGPAPADVNIPSAPLSSDTLTLPTMMTPSPVAGAGQTAPVNTPAQPPVSPSIPGTALERPVNEGPKDYANMMQEALAEPAPVSQMTGMPNTQGVPEAVGGSMPDASNATMNLPGQPVEKPMEAILPPPPAPVVDVNGVPTLPPVQMPPRS